MIGRGRRVLLILALVAPLKTLALSNDSITATAKSPLWLRLLHYRWHLPFGTRSEIDSPGFFLAKTGRSDPEAELRADLAAFAGSGLKIGPLQQSAQCAFPARYHYLKAELKLEMPDIPCPELEARLAEMQPYSVTLVFASAYEGDAGTLFGHTFLRVNAKAQVGQDKIDLLDSSISFAAAVPPDENGVSYAVLGMTGGFRGLFWMGPYYQKVGEYTVGENRDLWEYDLNLTPEQTRRMVEAAWELATGAVWTSYYFIDENCSYELLALLEIANPDWHVTDYFIHVIPAETVKTVEAVPGAVTAIHYRPSLRKKTQLAVDQLSPQARADFDRLTATHVLGADDRHADVLEALALSLYYKRAAGKGKLSPQDEEFLRACLNRLASLPRAEMNKNSLIGVGTMPGDPRERPDLGHPPYRVGLGQGAATAAGGFQELTLKLAYHDLLNDDRGYPRFSQVNFPNLSLRYYDSRHLLNIDRVELVSMASLSPPGFLEIRFHGPSMPALKRPRILDASIAAWAILKAPQARRNSSILSGAWSMACSALTPKPAPHSRAVGAPAPSSNSMCWSSRLTGSKRNLPPRRFLTCPKTKDRSFFNFVGINLIKSILFGRCAAPSWLTCIPT